MSEILADSYLKFPARELSAEDAKRNFTSNASKSPTALVNSFLEWQFAEQLFEYAVFTAGNQRPLGIFRRGRKPFPAVCLAASKAKEYRELLVTSALRGFEVIIANHGGPDELYKFFANFGYVISSKSPETNVATSLMKAAWNASELGSALEVAVKLGATAFCCFAHDADPIYIVTT